MLRTNKSEGTAPTSTYRYIRPSKKDTKSTNVNKYLIKVTIASDGLLFVRKSDPLCPHVKLL